MRLQKTTYDGKELYYVRLYRYRCYFHKDLVRKIDVGNQFDYTVDFPIIGCDIVEVDSNLVIVPGNNNLFIFSCDECKIHEIDSVIKMFDTDGGDYALILSKKDRIKIKWSNGNEQWITLLYTDGKQEDIPNEELLKYL